jgi:hypothetical protein
MDEMFNDLDAMLAHLQPRADHDPVAHEMLYRYVLPLMQELRAWRLLHLQRGAGYSEGQVIAVLGRDRLWWRTAANMLQQQTSMWGDAQWTTWREQHPAARGQVEL